MIFETLQVIKEEVDAYFEGATISLENIATLDEEGEGGGDSGDVILSLINMQEEFALKNNSNNYINNTDVQYKNPRVHLNLYIQPYQDCRILSRKKGIYSGEYQFQT